MRLYRISAKQRLEGDRDLMPDRASTASRPQYTRGGKRINIPVRFGLVRIHVGGRAFLSPAPHCRATRALQVLKGVPPHSRLT